MESLKFLINQDVAELLRIKSTTLAIWRVRGMGPTYCKADRWVIYYKSDVMSWLDSQKHQP
ncbi:helix-turn-helix domain-containing protein [Entomomonas sp. E2T0]|uniref:helix-turn-helix domain-containing protein n=1 Tax=Entomomonas sp. E2T0 TaxID=2930213 RepID=UPI0022284003|nr:helix-turn-helix domain-containing protein [Entomomonas sp. E2T0]UYZ83194.1 helix-turn-helix domain-containing protein [Entomomonas sp. E2T0]